MVALMALSLSSTFVSCSDNDDDEPNLAKEIAGAYNGSYSLSLGAFEADTQKTTGEALAINGTSLNGTINADGTATVSIVFSPGSMPMPITAEFTGSNTQSSAQ